MKVRGKVTAVVGPNEAGKSTLLRGLASISTNEPFTDVPGGDIPRRGSVTPDDIAIEVTFALDPDDKEAISGIGSATRPEKLTLSKHYGGQITYRVAPPVRRARDRREAALQALAVIDSMAALVDDNGSADAHQAAHALDALTERAKSILDDPLDSEDLSEEAIADLEALMTGLRSASDTLGDTEPVVSALEAAVATERAAHPSGLIGAELLKHRPVFALFSAADRDLAYEYNLNGMTGDSIPAALQNLAVSAGLSVELLLADISAQKWDAVTERVENANDALADLFGGAWTAGSGTAHVRLKQDDTMMRVMVTSKVGRFSPISERSDGLRMFVALTTFVRARADGRPVVLLIDEAENHLHYDAQADLMGVLARQELASQVIYTTHSAGCLPDELGGNIVAVVPNLATGYSTIDSSYWTGGLGFTPLMMAMGAGAAAITPSRYAILAEGHSEALVLPRLIREATGLHRLGYQVAAGIAEAGSDEIPTLDAEAAHVAYLVDGDEGGEANAKKLARAGVDNARIVHLGGEGSDLCLESLIDEAIYQTCADETRNVLGRDPSKPEVAARLLDVDETLVAPNMTDVLAKLHVQLSNALQIPLDRRPKLTSR